MPAAPLFVTRKFPPSVGGMETLAAGVWRALRRDGAPAYLIALGRSNRNLVWWLPVTAVRTIYLLARRRAGLVLSGDALTFAVLWPLLRLFRVPTATMIMGLDVTFDNRIYRALVHPALRAAPSVLAISDATAEAAVAVGVDRSRITVVRLGVEVPDVSADDRAEARRAVHAEIGLPAGAVALLTLGRLVRRKGVRWFVSEVVPGLPQRVHYLVAGSGPEQDAIADSAREHGVGDRVHLLGRVDDDVRERLLRGADLFVQPNVVVPDDVEGFGLVTIEAAMRGTPVLAADLQGIKDAVVDGSTGWLVPAGDRDAWIGRVAAAVADLDGLAATGASFQGAARARYGEDAMAAQLRAALPGPGR